MTGNGFDDLVIYAQALRQFYVIPGGPAGAGQAALAFDLQGINGGLEIQDLDSDGNLDIMLSRNNEVVASFGGSSGTFSAPIALAAGGRLGAEPLAGDLDGDGLLDLVTAGVTDILWAKNLGARTFDFSQSVAASPVPSSTQLVDLDADGDLDITWGEEGFSQTDLLNFWVENLGAGTFGPKTRLFREPTDGRIYRPLGFRDVDGDTDLDAYFAVGEQLALAYNQTMASFGDSVCSMVIPNSTGFPGQLRVIGTTAPLVGPLRLSATSLPRNSFGYFLCSQQSTPGQVVPNSVGRLCLGGSIGRYARPSEIQMAGALGEFSLNLDVTAVPTPAAGRVPIQPGETWAFQAWHRDISPIGVTSNFTDAIEVQF